MIERQKGACEMGFVPARAKRSKQINVRLTFGDAKEFNEVMRFYHHQTASDSVRDMVRNGYLTLLPKDANLINYILGKVYKPHGEEYRKENQLNVRLSLEEQQMADSLALKMSCGSTSEVIRKLINIYYAVTQGKLGDQLKEDENT